MRKTRRKSDQAMPEILSEYEKEFKDNKITNRMKNTILDTIYDEVYNPSTAMIDFYLNQIISGIMLKYNGDGLIDLGYVGDMVTSILAIKYDKRLYDVLTQDLINEAYYRYDYKTDVKEEMTVDHILDIDYLINMLRNIETDNDKNYETIINDDFWNMFSKFEPEIELSDYNPLKELVFKYKHEFHYGYIKKYMHEDIINALRLYYNKYDINKQLYHNAYKKMHKAVEEKDELNIICYTILVNTLWYESDNRERDRNYRNLLIEKYDYTRYM